MTTNEWVTMLSSLAALGACILGVLTLQEMSRQRKTTYLPYLVVPSFHLYLHRSWVDGAQRPTYWSFDVSPPGVSPSRPPHEILISIHNIGMGPGKNARASWRYDARAMVREAASLDTDHVFDVELNDDALLIPKTFRRRWHMSIGAHEEIGHILPCSLKADPTIVGLPPSYLDMLSVLWYLRWIRWLSGMEVSYKESDDVPEDDIDVPEVKDYITQADFGIETLSGERYPPIELTLACEDLGNSTHTRVLSFTPEAVSPGVLRSDIALSLLFKATE